MVARWRFNHDLTARQASMFEQKGFHWFYWRALKEFDQCGINSLFMWIDATV